MPDPRLNEIIRELLEACPDPVMVDDSGGRMLFVNSAFENTFRMSREQLQHYDFEDFTAPEHRSRLLKLHISRLSGKPVPDRVEFTGLRTDGKRLFLQSTISMLNSGENSFFLTILRVVTRRADASDSQREALAFNSSVVVCENILRRIQNSSRPDLPELLRGAMEENDCPLERTDVGMLVLEMAGKLKKLLDETIRVSFSVDPGIPELLLPVRTLKGVLRAVTDNSLYAMGNGGHIHLRAVIDNRPVTSDEEDSASMASSRRIRIEIADNGTGMDREVLSRVFEPFFTTKDPELHSGMGLFEARLRLREMHGEIEVFSPEGSGTVVSILLPCV